MKEERYNLNPEDAQQVLLMFKIIEENGRHSGRFPNIAGAAANFLSDLEDNIAEETKARQKAVEAQKAQAEQERQAEVKRVAEENLQQAKQAEQDRIAAEAQAQAEAQVPPAKVDEEDEEEVEEDEEDEEPLLGEARPAPDAQTGRRV